MYGIWVSVLVTHMFLFAEQLFEVRLKVMTNSLFVVFLSVVGDGGRGGFVAGDQ